MSEEIDPRDTPEYQAFVESMVKYCRCEFDRPCEGVLCGGLCDEKKTNPIHCFNDDD